MKISRNYLNKHIRKFKIISVKSGKISTNLKKFNLTCIKVKEKLSKIRALKKKEYLYHETYLNEI